MVPATAHYKPGPAGHPEAALELVGDRRQVHGGEHRQEHEQQYPGHPGDKPDDQGSDKERHERGAQS